VTGTGAPTAAGRLAQVRRALAGRALFWFGIRGEDAQSLLQLPEFAGSFAITAPLRAASLPAERNVVLEALAERRVDLDEYDLDLDGSVEADQFRRALADATSQPSVLLTYRPAGFVSSLGFSRDTTLTEAGMFARRQAAFEHKPWVETSLRARGITMPPWTYVTREQTGRLRRLLQHGPHILRANSSSGGVGIARVRTVEDAQALWPQRPDHFAAVAPELTDAIPVNVGGCVFPDGTIRLHPPSVQLIGIEACTERPFGFCGNDFGAIADLDHDGLVELDALSREVGQWLHEERYVGAFGLDALVDGPTVHFLEVNPRFQGSSSLGAELATTLNEPTLYLDALAAHLGVDAGGTGRTLSDWALDQPARSHAVVHRRHGDPGATDYYAGEHLRTVSADVTLRPEVPKVDLGGVLGRLVFDRSVTTTGFELDDGASTAVRGVRGMVDVGKGRERG
jgi:hypothetical protein